MSFEPTNLNRMCELLARAGAPFAPDRARLAAHIEDLIVAVGVDAAADEKAELFLVLGAEEPDNRELAEYYAALAVSDNPLAALGTPDGDPGGPTRRALAHGKPDAQLSPKALRANLAATSAWFRQHVRRGAPGKHDQSTLMIGLAALFLSFAGDDRHWSDLPHAERSHFIQFAHLALQRFFPATEVSPRALSSRWHRLKNQHFDAQ